MLFTHKPCRSLSLYYPTKCLSHETVNLCCVAYTHSIWMYKFTNEIPPRRSHSTQDAVQCFLHTHNHKDTKSMMVVMATLLTHCCESVSSSSLARPRNRTIPKQPLVSRDVGCWTLYRHRYRAFRQPSGVNMRETANIHEWLPATKYEVKRGSRPSTHIIVHS